MKRRTIILNEKFYDKFVKEVQQIVNKAEQALTRCENRMFLNDVMDLVKKKIDEKELFNFQIWST